MADWKITDPLVKGAIQTGGLLSNFLPKGFATPIKTLNDTLQGSTESITENNLTPEQLSFLKDIILQKNQKEGAITYKDYYKYYHDNKDKRGIDFAPGLFSLFDPYGQMQTTLGQFNFKIDKNGNISIKDAYDFNPLEHHKQTAETALGLYGAIREYAGRQIPEGTGRPVNINITGLEPSIK